MTRLMHCQLFDPARGSFDPQSDAGGWHGRYSGATEERAAPPRRRQARHALTRLKRRQARALHTDGYRIPGSLNPHKR